MEVDPPPTSADPTSANLTPDQITQSAPPNTPSNHGTKRKEPPASTPPKSKKHKTDAIIPTTDPEAISTVCKKYALTTAKDEDGLEWLLCRLCSAFGLKGKKRTFIKAVDPPFRDAKLRSHAREHAEWKQYQEEGESCLKEEAWKERYEERAKEMGRIRKREREGRERKQNASKDEMDKKARREERKKERREEGKKRRENRIGGVLNLVVKKPKVEGVEDWVGRAKFVKEGAKSEAVVGDRSGMGKFSARDAWKTVSMTEVGEDVKGYIGRESGDVDGCVGSICMFFLVEGVELTAVRDIVQVWGGVVQGESKEEWSEQVSGVGSKVRAAGTMLAKERFGEGWGMCLAAAQGNVFVCADGEWMHLGVGMNEDINKALDVIIPKWRERLVVVWDSEEKGLQKILGEQVKSNVLWMGAGEQSGKNVGDVVQHCLPMYLQEVKDEEREEARKGITDQVEKMEGQGGFETVLRTGPGRFWELIHSAVRGVGKNQEAIGSSGALDDVFWARRIAAWR